MNIFRTLSITLNQNNEIIKRNLLFLFVNLLIISTVVVGMFISTTL